MLLYKLNLFIITILLLCISVFSFDYFYDGFEKDSYKDHWGNNDNINPAKWIKYWNDTDKLKNGKEFGKNSYKAVSNPVREGKRAIKFEYDPNNKEPSSSDPSGYRTRTHVEIKEVDIKGPFNKHEPCRYAPIGKNSDICWYGFSLFLPVDFFNSVGTKDGMIMQFHSFDNYRDRPKPEDMTPQDSLEYEGTGRSPNFYLSFNSKEHGENKLAIITLWTDIKYQTKQTKYNVVKVVHNVIDPVLGGWNDFVICVRWDYDRNPVHDKHDKYNPDNISTTGFLKVWHNDILKVDYTGPTSYYDLLGPYFCMGLYHQRHTQKIIMYGDSYRTGNSYGEVTPRTPKDLGTILNTLVD